MAISREDGSIILKTKIDESGLKTGFAKMKNLASKAAKGFAVIGAAAATATVAITKMAVSAYADYEQLVGGVETLFKDSAGKVLEYANQAFQTAGVSANEYMQQVTSFSASLLSSLAGDTDKAADVANMALIDISDNANKMGSSLESVTLAYQGFAKQQYMLLDNLKLGYGGTKTEMERLLKDAQALTGVKYDINNLADVYSAIHAIQEQLGITETTMKEAKTTITGSLGMVKSSWQNLLTAMAGGGDLDRAINNFVYSLEKFTANIVPVIERTLLGLGQAIQRTLPMLVQTVVSALVQQIPNLVMAVYNMIVGLFKGIVLGIKALFTGGTAKATEVIKGNVSGISSGASSAADNMNDVADATKKAGKEAKKSLAAFDELNILSSGASGGSGAGETPEASMPTISAGGGGGGETYNNSFVDKIDADLAAIMGYVGFALVAIGVLLICFGHIGWGIGFIIAGAALFSVSQAALSEGAEAEKVKNIMNGIITGISLLALVLGIILVCTTKNPKTLALGIGLIVVGAAGLATEIALNWNAIKENVQKFFTENGALIAGVSLALLVIGVLLCFAHQWGLGIGLIAAGAVGLAAVVAVNWNAIKDAVTKFIDENTGLIIGVAAALLVLGIILCLCGVITPLSIGLIVAGAGILAAEVALNWEETKNTITKFFQDNAGLIVGISLAILVLGILLCCCGIITPLSIGMIVFGAAGLVATVALNWNAITTAISNFFKNNAGLVVGISLALLVLGILLLATGVGIPLGIALIAAGAVGLAAVVALNWNTIKEKVSTAFDATINWVKTWGLLVLGIILCISGVGIPLGIALMKKGGANLAEAQDPLWTTIVDKVKETWNAIKTFWNTHIAKWFTKEHWAGLAKNMMNGLIGKIEAGLNKILEKFHNANIGKAVDFIAGGLGFDIPKSIKIPRLAKGAVIPPNREFLAVLGDNKKENEIVSPVSTMKQAFTEALIEMGGNFGGGNTEVVLEIDGREFGRAVVEQGNRENRRIGTRLVIA